MISPFTPIVLVLLVLLVLHLPSTLASHATPPSDDPEPDPIPINTRNYWMRRASSVLQELKGSPCPFEAFGAVIVNHTDVSSGWGELGREVCVGVNRIGEVGNPVLHGEISAMNNCSAILTDPEGRYKLSPREAIKALEQLSLYTTAEPCPMCATAIAYSRFADLVYGTSIKALSRLGWKQLPISSVQILESARNAGVQTLPGTRVVGGLLGNETDGLFGWQFGGEKECPKGCARRGEDMGTGCVVLGEHWGGKQEL